MTFSWTSELWPAFCLYSRLLFTVMACCHSNVTSNSSMWTKDVLVVHMLPAGWATHQAYNERGCLWRPGVWPCICVTCLGDMEICRNCFNHHHFIGGSLSKFFLKYTTLFHFIISFESSFPLLPTWLLREYRYQLSHLCSLYFQSTYVMIVKKKTKGIYHNPDQKGDGRI